MAKKLICPVCEEGTLTPEVYAEEFAHPNGPIVVEGLECHLCDACGADPVLEDQVRRNHARICDAKRRASGLLAGPEIKQARRALGLTQQQASELFGGGQNAFSKYERGEVSQSVAMDRLVKCALEFPFIIGFLALESGREGFAAGIDDYNLSPPGKDLIHFAASTSYAETKPAMTGRWQATA